MGTQEPIDEETTPSAGRNSAASDAHRPSTDTPDAEEHQSKPTTQDAETDELVDDRFQATDN